MAAPSATWRMEKMPHSVDLGIELICAEVRCSVGSDMAMFHVQGGVLSDRGCD